MRTAIAERERRLRSLQAEIRAINQAAAVLQAAIEAAPEPLAAPPEAGSSSPQPQKKWPVPIADAAFLALKRGGARMPLKELLKKLAEMGVRPSRATLDSCLRRDPQKRFVNYGRATWGLRELNSPATSNSETVRSV